MENRLIELLKLMLKYGSQDLHLSVEHGETTINIKIDNNYTKVKPKIEDYKLVRYIQYLANLDTSNLLTPQTGMFELYVEGKLLQIKAATINSQECINMVLRIQNKKTNYDLDDSNENKLLKDAANHNCGLILITGTTNSGKTNTMYELLKTMQNRKIYTLEDPVEIYNEQFIQIQVNNEAGLGFKEGIKQILRHDPDVLAINSLRPEAVNMCMVAATTGHLVIAEMHASSSTNAIERLREYGVDDKILCENLLCITNQRLITDNKGQKRVVKEIMDKDEINCFIKTNHVSPKFISLQAKLNN